MNPKQEIKIVNNTDGSCTFFFRHNFKEASEHALEYVQKNRDKFPMTVYRCSEAPVGPKWIYVRTIDVK